MVKLHKICTYCLNMYFMLLKLEYLNNINPKSYYSNFEVLELLMNWFVTLNAKNFKFRQFEMNYLIYF